MHKNSTKLKTVRLRVDLLCHTAAASVMVWGIRVARTIRAVELPGAECEITTIYYTVCDIEGVLSHYLE